MLTRTLGVITRAIETDLIHRAGLTRKNGARSGIVTLSDRIECRNLAGWECRFQRENPFLTIQSVFLQKQ